MNVFEFATPASIATALLLAVVLSGTVVSLVRWATQRSARRRFAEARQWRYLGIVSSEREEPYTRFDDVRASILLHHVMQGRWGGFEMVVFERHQRRKGQPFTCAIISIPDDGRYFHGGSSLAAPTAGRLTGPGIVPPMTVEVQVDYVYVNAGVRVAIERLPEFVDVAASLARSLATSDRA